MSSYNPSFVESEHQTRPEITRSKDGYPPTAYEDDIALMEDNTLDQANILCGDMLAFREALVRDTSPLLAI